MPISREPSQRTKAWAKWNYGQHSNASKASLATTTPAEIIHLGGSRVGSPELSPRPGTAQDFDRPVTTWFPAPYAPPPEPPVGIKRSQTDPQGLLSPSPTPTSYTSATDSTCYSPAPLSIPSEKLPSPLSATNSATSLPKLQSPSTTLPTRTSSLSDRTRQLRRTQSISDIQKNAARDHYGSSKALPPKPRGSLDRSEPDTDRSNIKHVGQLLNEEARLTQWFPTIPPRNGPPPTKPLPAIRGLPTPEASPVEATRSGRRDKAPSPQSSARATATAGSSAAGATSPRTPTWKHSPQERLWLHRNYRGEATFLKAWGLKIESEEDREEGLVLMRELMDAEEEKKRAKKAQKARELGLPDGLQIIIEEEKASLSEPDKPSPRMISHQDLSPGAAAATTHAASAASQNLRLPGRVRSSGHTSPGLSPTERHLRSESESSVLGAYLDIRMSRMD
ncbi:hypothetical protein BX600DRAFT_452708 [Xylariales sp. PMI_506]|nr:hypothetical protein BX600DRAFT_452708 [Xylariales sp. PMI_506]